ncbi:hypothetical protein FB451DRAFT_1449734 [Mycena latifolia]|nr:hypothetical protein FB451DRAFT_1451729 [Mycena latifolia]KAJ7438159.1 hypothetical protein FB451DRAFT_1449734 [Mycena latifolia]
MHSTEILTSMNTASLATLDRADSSLWYSDGNLVIHAGHMIFRVYRGMLARQSPLLREMVSPSKLSTYGVIEGCPVLDIPHSASETAYFLAAIFDANSFDSLLGRISFDAIAAVLRLSSEYQIPELRRKALILLSDVYPMSLLQFSRMELAPSYGRDQILPVIELARAHGADWILPLAFYRFCLEMTGRSLMYGVEYDGTQVLLSSADAAACHDALAAIHAQRLADVLARYQTRLADTGCTGGDACRTSRFREADTLLQRLTDLPELFISWAPEPGSRLCAACLAEMHDWHCVRTEAAWDGLPAMFGLPGWTTLEKLKSAALGEPEEDENESY